MSVRGNLIETPGVWCRIWFIVLFIGGCATALPTAPEVRDITTPIVFGRAVALVTGKTTRWYEPQVRFFELVNRKTHERFKVDVQSEDKTFVLQLPAGEYELSRVQISEGPFLSMADLLPRSRSARTR